MLPLDGLHRRRPVHRDRRRLLHEAARRRRRRRSSKSSRPRAIRCAAGRPRAPRSRRRRRRAVQLPASPSSSVVADPDADVDLVNALLGGADAVVWSRGSRLAEHAGFAPDEIHRRHPHLTVTAITPFGLEGPWADRPATEFTLQAWSGGIVGLGRGAAGPRPGVRRRADRRVARRRLRRAGDDGRRDARRASSSTCRCSRPRPRPHLLPGDLLRRCAGPAVPRRPSAHRARRRDGDRRPRRPRAAAPASSGSTSARWSATTSGSTRTRSSPSPNRPTCTPTRSPRGCASTTSTRSSTWPPPSASRTRRRQRRQRHRRSTTSPSAGAFVTNPRDGFDSARPSLPRHSVARALTAARAPARRAHRRRTAETASGAKPIAPDGRAGRCRSRVCGSST